MNFIRTLFFLIIFSNPIFARQIDTLQADLGEVVVVGFEGNRSLMETPGAITNINAERIGGFDESSLLYGLNTVPGVRFEQRAAGSYRVAIRGSSLRSPFGVRNVKVYWNGIPFTEPSGSTFLNLLDVINMQHVEVIRGPAGSIYGAGNGGVLLLESRQSNQSEVGAGTSIGSYGLQRYTAYAQNQFEGGNLRFNYSNQHSDGYREQNFFDRQTAELSGRFQLNDKQIIKTNFLYSDLNYGIPGGLNLQQYNADPSQARPGSEETNASIDQQTFLAGISHDMKLSNNLSNLTTLYGTFTAFENPFNFDYKKDSRKSGGGRTRFYYDTQLGEIRTRFTFGGEFQAANYAARNFGNNDGKVGGLNFDDEIKIQSSLIFVNTEIDLPKDFYVTGGLSYNRLEYSLYRLVANIENDTTGLAEKTFNPEIIPRVGILKKISPALSLHGSVSFGFSPPTIEEFRTNEGSIALNLEAEQGTNFEIGARGSLRDFRLSYDLTTFYFKLDETIIQEPPPDTTRDTFVFTNAGNADLFGIELSANWMVIENNDSFLNRLNWRLSYTWNHFRFKNYVKFDNEGERLDYSGNALTGAAPHTLVSTLNAQTKTGIYGSLSYNFTDEIPLNDANSVYSDSYHLLQTKAGFKTELTGNINLDIFFGIDNLLNEKYSLGNDINAFGDRFYQPAPPRNWFSGVKVNVEL